MWKAHPTHTHIQFHPDGFARNTHTKRAIRGSLSQKGYRRINLTNTSVTFHRALLETFVPCPDPKLHAAHIDHDKTNNRLDNLKWLTAAENNVENIARGALSTRKQRALTDEEAREFWRLHRAGAKNGQLARRFGKKTPWAEQIVRRRLYAEHLS